MNAPANDRGNARSGAFEVRIVGGGETDPSGQAAIVEAVMRVMRARASGRVVAGSAWARAGRLEASGAPVTRARTQLPPR